MGGRGRDPRCSSCTAAVSSLTTSEPARRGAGRPQGEEALGAVRRGSGGVKDCRWGALPEMGALVAAWRPRRETSATSARGINECGSAGAPAALEAARPPRLHAAGRAGAPSAPPVGKLTRNTRQDFAVEVESRVGEDCDAVRSECSARCVEARGCRDDDARDFLGAVREQEATLQHLVGPAVRPVHFRHRDRPRTPAHAAGFCGLQLLHRCC
jgi:hypothetical protein